MQGHRSDLETEVPSPTEAFSGPASPGPESATLAAVAPAIDVAIRQTPMRAYAIVDAKTSLYFERVSTLVSMLEHPVAKAAPVGSFLLRDSDDGSRSVVVAERVLDGGWLIREVAP